MSNAKCKQWIFTCLQLAGSKQCGRSLTMVSQRTTFRLNGAGSSTMRSVLPEPAEDDRWHELPHPDGVVPRKSEQVSCSSLM